MKTSSLHALVIDRHAGELTPEAEELLALHLAQNTEARAEADRILASLTATHDAVLRHPELAHVTPAPVERTAVAAPRRSFVMPWLARAAVVALLAAVTGITGFVAGRSGPGMASHEGRPSAPAPRKESPWARYRMSFDPAGGGMQVVRVDADNLETNSMP